MRQDELVPAYVIQARAWRETSLLYKMIAYHYGRISLIHRGVRNSRRDRPLPTLTPVRVSWGGRGSLYTLRHAEVGRPMVVRDPERQVYALYINEIVSYLLPDGRYSDEIYPLYHEALAKLEAAPDAEFALRGIEMDLLQLAGHPLQLDHTEGGKVEPQRRYRYHPGAGPVELPESDEAGGVGGQTLLALRDRQEMGEGMRREARRLMRKVLDYYVSPHVIRSRDIMQAMTGSVQKIPCPAHDSSRT